MGPGSVTGGTLGVTWNASFYDVSLSNLTVQMPDTSYTVNGSQRATSGTAFFGFSATANGPNCCTGCSAGVTGFFAGTTAERAGITYHIADDRLKDVLGAAAFKKN
jgi:hypothetical protein